MSLTVLEKFRIKASDGNLLASFCDNDCDNAEGDDDADDPGGESDLAPRRANNFEHFSFFFRGKVGIRRGGFS